MFTKVLLHSISKGIPCRISESAVRSFSETSPTLFEKIASKQIPSTLLYEDDKVLYSNSFLHSVVLFEMFILVLQLIFL